MDVLTLKEQFAERIQLYKEKKEREKAKLTRLFEEEKLRHRSAYRFTPVEILEIKRGLETHLEEMVEFLVGHKYTLTPSGYYYLWELPFKVGYKGIFDLNKPHWTVPAQDLIWFWVEMRRDGRNDDEWNFHSACVEIKQWLKMLEAGAFKKANPSVVEYHRQKRQHDLRRSLADLFKEGKLESITLRRQYGDGRMKTKRVSVLALRRALQVVDPEVWGNVQSYEFWNFIVDWMNDEEGRWVKFEKQFKKRENTEQVFLVLTLDGYETPEEEQNREREELFAKEHAEHVAGKLKALEHAKLVAEAEVREVAERKKKDEEYVAARAAMTPEQKEEESRKVWENMIKNSPIVFTSFLKDDPSLSRYIPEDCRYPFEIAVRH
jgi:hypothetical protein